MAILPKAYIDVHLKYVVILKLCVLPMMVYIFQRWYNKLKQPKLMLCLLNQLTEIDSNAMAFLSIAYTLMYCLSLIMQYYIEAACVVNNSVHLLRLVQ